MNTEVYRANSRFFTVAVQSAVAPVEDWDSTILFPSGMKILSISMIPTGIGDTVLIEDGQLGGFIFGYTALRIGEQHTKYFRGADGKGVICTPYFISGVSAGNYGIHFELA